MWYRVLGPLEVRDGERLVAIGGRQQQRLLAALLTEPGRLDRDRSAHRSALGGRARPGGGAAHRAHVRAPAALGARRRVDRDARGPATCSSRPPARSTPRNSRTSSPRRGRLIRIGRSASTTAPCRCGGAGRSARWPTSGGRWPPPTRLDELHVTVCEEQASEPDRHRPGGGCGAPPADARRRAPVARAPSAPAGAGAARHRSPGRGAAPSCRRCARGWPTAPDSTRRPSCVSSSTRSPTARPVRRAAGGRSAATSSTTPSARVRSVGSTPPPSPAPGARWR